MRTVKYWLVERTLYFGRGSHVRIQIGSFQNPADANQLAEKLRAEWRSEEKKQIARLIGAEITHEMIPVKCCVYDSMEEFEEATVSPLTFAREA